MDNARKVQTYRQGIRLTAAISSIRLPQGMKWCDSGNITANNLTRGPRASWLTYITVKPTGLSSAHYVKPIRFGWLTESMDKGHIRDRIESAIYDFQRDIRDGVALIVRDGEMIPDDCAFDPPPDPEFFEPPE